MLIMMLVETSKNDIIMKLFEIDDWLVSIVVGSIALSCGTNTLSFK